MTILVITTGGTIGALPYENPAQPPQYSTMPPGAGDCVREALAQDPFNRFTARCVSLEQRDSKDIDEAYRAALAELLKHAPETRVLITHGTDTLLQTADYLYRQGISKTIVVTGAMTPLSNGLDSDGYRNLDFALNYLSNNPTPGVFVVLSDGTPSDWQPRLYPFEPGRYEKFYDADGRYHRLRVIEP